MPGPFEEFPVHQELVDTSPTIKTFSFGTFITEETITLLCGVSMYFFLSNQVKWKFRLLSRPFEREVYSSASGFGRSF